MADADADAGGGGGSGWPGVVDELYAVALADFTPERDRRAKELKGADAALAARVKALRKPSTAAWVVNLLVRREAEQVDQVLELGASLRAAAEELDGEQLRALTKQRRQLTAAVTTRARGLARAEGVKVSATVADQVEGTLHAAMLSAQASDAVRTGALVRAIEPSEVGGLGEGTDLADAVAHADLLGTRATPTQAPEPGRPTLRVVPDDGAARRAAEEALTEAQEVLEQAQAEASEAEETVTGLRARSLQLEQELEELRRRMAELDTDLEDVVDQLEEAEASLEEATGARDEAQAAVTDAEQALARLERD